MSPLYYLLPPLLVYIIWRAYSHYKAGRTQFFIVTCFVGAVVAFEIVFAWFRVAGD
jgi:positive regulator of sigma E activity